MRPLGGLLALATVVLGGCNVAAWGNIVVVALTVALFCGTLSLGRRLPPGPTGDAPDRESVES